MMKKVWLVLLAVVLVFGFAVLGCGGGGGEEIVEGGGGTLNPPATLELTENTYSTGYQAFVNVGKAIKKDDEWKIDVKFTVSRDVPGGIQIGLVDTVTDYWNPLSWDKDAKEGEPGAIFNTGALVEGEEYTLNKTFIALKDSGGAGTTYNRLVFQTEKEYERATSEEGSSISAAQTPGPITITFTGVTPPEPPEGGDFDALGDFIYNKGTGDSDGAESQAVWQVTDRDTLRVLKEAEALVIVMENPLAGGVQFIWQSASDSWAWNQKNITNNAGEPIEGVEFEYSEEYGLYGLVIDLASVVDKYTEFQAACDSGSIKIILAYFTGATKIHTLGIVGTVLIPSENQTEYVEVTFNANGGAFSDGEETKTVEVVKGESLGSKFPANPIKAGYNLTSWVDGDDEVYGADTPIESDVTLTAVWAAGDPDKWTVTFNADGGTPVPDAIEVFDGSEIGDDNFPANPKKANFVFMGWFDGDTLYTGETIITGDVALKAKWTAIGLPSAPTTEPSATGYLFVQDLFIDGDMGESGTTTLANWAMGKGNIKGDDLTAIRGAESDSIVLLSVICTVTGKGGYGSGKVGGSTEWKVASPYTVNETFFIQIPVSGVLTGVASSATYIFVNVYNDCVIQKAQLWEPDPDYVPPPPPTELVLYEDDEWVGVTATIINDGGNTSISLSPAKDTTGFTKVYIQFTSASNYRGGSIEGNDAVGSSGWVNNAYWSGFEKVEPNGSGETDTFYGPLTKDDKTVGALLKIVIGSEDQFPNVLKIWLE
jgi:uncharacterized repeat protein (TIGR02543 family)